MTKTVMTREQFMNDCAMTMDRLNRDFAEKERLLHIEENNRKSLLRKMETLIRKRNDHRFSDAGAQLAKFIPGVETLSAGEQEALYRALLSLEGASEIVSRITPVKEE